MESGVKLTHIKVNPPDPPTSELPGPTESPLWQDTRSRHLELKISTFQDLPAGPETSFLCNLQQLQPIDDASIPKIKLPICG